MRARTLTEEPQANSHRYLRRAEPSGRSPFRAGRTNARHIAVASRGLGSQISRRIEIHQKRFPPNTGEPTLNRGGTPHSAGPVLKARLGH